MNTFAKWIPLAAALAVPVAPAQDTPAPAAAQEERTENRSAELLAQAMEMMTRDGALREADRYQREPQEVAKGATMMYEALDLTRRGIMDAKDYPWLPVAMRLYEARKKTAPPVAVLQLLLDAGADVNAVDAAELPAFAYAGKSPEVCRFLLEAGSNPTLSTCGRLRVLHLALEDRSGEMLGMLLAAGANFNRCEANGVSALHLAAILGNLAACRLLLDAGAEVNLPTSNACADEKDPQRTAMDFALLRQQSDVAKLLAERGGRSSVKPIFAACVMGDEEGVRKLLAEGANVNEVESDVTLLEAAAYSGHEGVCSLLLEAGASPTSYAPDDRRHTTPLHAAARGGRAAVCRRLIAAGADVDVPDSGKSTPLMYAVLQDDLPTIEALLAAGANVNAVSSDGDSALRMAVQIGKPAVVRRLLEAGAQVVDSPGKRPLLSLALECGAEVRREVIDILLAAGADVSARDVEGDTPLREAMMRGREEAFEQFVCHGKGLDVVGNDGLPPLLKALELKKPGLCLRLLEAGAGDDETRRRVFAEAVKSGYVDVCRWLVDHGLELKRQPALHLAAMLGRLDDVKACLAEGAPLKTRYKNHTALTYAARMGHAEVCRALIEAGADVNVRESKGWSPLIAAVDSGSVETCAVLIAAGADVNVQHGSQPLLVIAVQNRYPELVQALLAAGADVGDRDAREGKSALHWAAVTPGMGAVCEMLIAAGADVNAREANTQNTPLHCAVSAWREMGLKSPVARRLIAAGADATLQNDKGKTPENIEQDRYIVIYCNDIDRPSF